MVLEKLSLPAEGIEPNRNVSPTLAPLVSLTGEVLPLY